MQRGGPSHASALATVPVTPGYGRESNAELIEHRALPHMGSPIHLPLTADSICWDVCNAGQDVWTICRAVAGAMCCCFDVQDVEAHISFMLVVLIIEGEACLLLHRQTDR